ncbi:MAG: Mth938-like domain-containing protein [Pseudomonadota bacterium]
MRLNEIEYQGQPPVDGYGPGGFRVAGVWHEGAVILGPAGAAAMPGDAISAAALAPVLAIADQLDLVLVGQGAEIAPLPAAMRAALEDAGLGVEAMSTPSACRTYNVLLSEERRVAALLFPV